MFELNDFEEIVKAADGSIKPIIIIKVDGGPDENPRHQKTIRAMIRLFKKYNFDSVIVATNAPGRSAFNPVERRMSYLTGVMATLILPHQALGEHLDASGRTIDVEKEKENFLFAAQILAETFETLSIDGYNVVSKAVNPESSEIDHSEINDFDHKWIHDHVQASQYCLQIMKCKDENCCQAPRSIIFDLLKTRFLPPPICFKSINGVTVRANCNEQKVFYLDLFQSMTLEEAGMPYDANCSSMAKKVKSLTCKHCQKYFATAVMLKEHVKTHRTEVQSKKIKRKPLKVIAKRGPELYVQYSEDEEIEWDDRENVDIEDSDLPQEPQFDSAFEELNIAEQATPIWEII